MAIIALTPIGVLGLVAPIIAKYGLAPLVDLLPFVLVVLTGLALHLLVVLPLMGYVFGRINVYSHLAKLKSVILFAFSTASSAATLPLNIEHNVKKAGIHKRIAELVLPIGSTINMDGTSLYQVAVALFVAQALGVELSFMQQVTVALTVILASVGTAGIPGAGIVMLTTVFATIGLPMDAIGIIMVVDRILDMFRTAVNISGDTVVTAIVNRVFDKDLQKSRN
jgi:Na+/H+-dicarboxylate symporter